MKVWVVLVLMGAAALWATGCGETRNDVPPLEPTDLAATAGADQGTGVVVTGTAPTGTAGVRPPGAIPKTYTVKKSEGLMAIARTVYGDVTMWRKIYEANKDKVGPPPTYILKEGEVLTMPPRQ